MALLNSESINADTDIYKQLIGHYEKELYQYITKFIFNIFLQITDL